MYIYLCIPIGDCMLYIHNGIRIYIGSTSLFHSCLTPSIYMLEIDLYAKQKQQQRLMSNVTLPSHCTSADGSGIASGVVLMPKDSKKLSGGPTAISLGKAHLKITPRFFKGKSSSIHLHDLGFHVSFPGVSFLQLIADLIFSRFSSAQLHHHRLPADGCSQRGGHRRGGRGLFDLFGLWRFGPRRL